MEISHYERIIEPTFPLLARQHKTALFDILFSLRVPLEPHLDEPENSDSDKARDFAYRQQHQAEWATHIEGAFLAALILRSILQKSMNRFSFRMVRLGQKFNPASMVPMVKSYVKATQQHNVLFCLSPVVRSFVRGEEPSSARVNVRAKVTIDGFEVNAMVAERESVHKDDL